MVAKLNKYKPDPKECALLLLRLVEDREQGRKQKMTRVRLAEMTLKHLWNRQRLTERFLREVEEWLLTAGWALVYAGSTFGAVKIETVENWPRVSWKRIADEIDEVVSGKFKFAGLEHFLATERTRPRADDDTDD
jgi:hypothetical protein